MDFPQSEISRGAALQALSFAVEGRPLVTLTNPERIALRVRASHGESTQELVPEGAELPYPSDRPYAVIDHLVRTRLQPEGGSPACTKGRHRLLGGHDEAPA